MKSYGGFEVYLHTYLTLELDGDELHNPTALIMVKEPLAPITVQTE